ncbi:hypothetical protein HGRIS_011716 [Hohenbuehelia grisea]|uniref:F-box domain-containing protein n=1 Tax=Hohenbuehelia grisea TaxID=104357 RepID=A0ABR3JXN8_9AGAR
MTQLTLITFPIELVYEILSYVEPADLVQLVRCCKSFRCVLLSERSSFVWHRAISNVPFLPTCPSLLSPPQYCALMTDAECSVCYFVDSEYIPAISLRLCETCRRKQVCWGMSTVRGFESVSEVSEIVHTLVPRVDKCKLYPTSPDNLSNELHHAYRVQDLSEVVKEYLLLEGDDVAQQRYVTQRQAYSNEMMEHACAITSRPKRLKEEKARILEERQRHVIARLLSLGYDQEAITEVLEYSDVKALVRVPERLTAISWNNILSTLTRVLQEDKRYQFARIVANMYQDYIDAYGGLIGLDLPSATEIMGHPTIDEALVTWSAMQIRETLKPARHTFNEIKKDLWSNSPILRVKLACIALNKSPDLLSLVQGPSSRSCPYYHHAGLPLQDASNILNLATTFFRLETKGNQPFYYPTVVPCLQGFADWAPSLHCAHYFKDAEVVATSLLKGMGLPATTTMKEVLSSGVKYNCLIEFAAGNLCPGQHLPFVDMY